MFDFDQSLDSGEFAQLDIRSKRAGASTALLSGKRYPTAHGAQIIMRAEVGGDYDPKPGQYRLWAFRGQWHIDCEVSELQARASGDIGQLLRAVICDSLGVSPDSFFGAGRPGERLLAEATDVMSAEDMVWRYSISQGGLAREFAQPPRLRGGYRDYPAGSEITGLLHPRRQSRPRPEIDPAQGYEPTAEDEIAAATVGAEVDTEKAKALAKLPDAVWIGGAQINGLVRPAGVPVRAGYFSVLVGDRMNFVFRVEDIRDNPSAIIKGSIARHFTGQTLIALPQGIDALCADAHEDACYQLSLPSFRFRTYEISSGNYVLGTATPAAVASVERDAQRATDGSLLIATDLEVVQRLVAVSKTRQLSESEWELLAEVLMADISDITERYQRSVGVDEPSLFAELDRMMAGLPHPLRNQYKNWLYIVRHGDQGNMFEYPPHQGLAISSDRSPVAGIRTWLHLDMVDGLYTRLQQAAIDPATELTISWYIRRPDGSVDLPNAGMDQTVIDNEEFRFGSHEADTPPGPGNPFFRSVGWTHTGRYLVWAVFTVESKAGSANPRPPEHHWIRRGYDVVNAEQHRERSWQGAFAEQKQTYEQGRIHSAGSYFNRTVGLEHLGLLQMDREVAGRLRTAVLGDQPPLPQHHFIRPEYEHFVLPTRTQRASNSYYGPGNVLMEATKVSAPLSLVGIDAPDAQWYVYSDKLGGGSQPASALRLAGSGSLHPIGQGQTITYTPASGGDFLIVCAPPGRDEYGDCDYEPVVVELHLPSAGSDEAKRLKALDDFEADMNETEALLADVNYNTGRGSTDKFIPLLAVYEDPELNHRTLDNLFIGKVAGLENEVNNREQWMVIDLDTHSRKIQYLGGRSGDRNIAIRSAFTTYIEECASPAGRLRMMLPKHIAWELHVDEQADSGWRDLAGTSNAQAMAGAFAIGSLGLAGLGFLSLLGGPVSPFLLFALAGAGGVTSSAYSIVDNMKARVVDSWRMSLDIISVIAATVGCYSAGRGLIAALQQKAIATASGVQISGDATEYLALSANKLAEAARVTRIINQVDLAVSGTEVIMVSVDCIMTCDKILASDSMTATQKETALMRAFSNALLSMGLYAAGAVGDIADFRQRRAAKKKSGGSDTRDAETSNNRENENESRDTNRSDDTEGRERTRPGNRDLTTEQQAHVDGIERLSFELELEYHPGSRHTELTRAVELFDFDALQRAQPDVLLKLSGYEIDGYLNNPSNFRTLDVSLQNEIFARLPQRSPYTELRQLLDRGGVVGDLPRGQERSRMAGAWQRLLREWRAIPVDSRRPSILLSNLGEDALARILLLHPTTSFRAPDELPPEIAEILSHLQYHRDGDAIEFKLRDDYVVTDPDLLLEELETLLRYLGLEDAVNDPLRALDPVSLHINISGPSVTDDYLRAWSFRNLVDYVDGGHGEMAVFGGYGYAQSLGSRGFVRRYSPSESPDAELRRLPMAPREALYLTEQELIDDLVARLNPATTDGRARIQRIIEVTTNEGSGGARALADFYECVAEWIRTGKVARDSIDVPFEMSVTFLQEARTEELGLSLLCLIPTTDAARVIAGVIGGGHNSRTNDMAFRFFDGNPDMVPLFSDRIGQLCDAGEIKKAAYAAFKRYDYFDELPLAIVGHFEAAAARGETYALVFNKMQQSDRGKEVLHQHLISLLQGNNGQKGALFDLAIEENWRDSRIPSVIVQSLRNNETWLSAYSRRIQAVSLWSFSREEITLLAEVIAAAESLKVRGVGLQILLLQSPADCGPRVVQVVSRLLSSDDASIRDLAIRVQQHLDITVSAEGLLRSSSPNDVRAGLAMLASRGETITVEQRELLLDLFTNDDNDLAQYAHTVAIGLPNYASDEFQLALSARLSELHPRVRSAVIRSLGTVTDQQLAVILAQLPLAGPSIRAELLMSLSSRRGDFDWVTEVRGVLPELSTSEARRLIEWLPRTGQLPSTLETTLIELADPALEYDLRALLMETGLSDGGVVRVLGVVRNADQENEQIAAMFLQVAFEQASGRTALRPYLGELLSDVSRPRIVKATLAGLVLCEPAIQRSCSLAVLDLLEDERFFSRVRHLCKTTEFSLSQQAYDALLFKITVDGDRKICVPALKIVGDLRLDEAQVAVLRMFRHSDEYVVDAALTSANLLSIDDSSWEYLLGRLGDGGALEQRMIANLARARGFRSEEYDLVIAGLVGEEVPGPAAWSYLQPETMSEQVFLVLAEQLQSEGNAARRVVDQLGKTMRARPEYVELIVPYLEGAPVVVTNAFLALPSKALQMQHQLCIVPVLRSGGTDQQIVLVKLVRELETVVPDVLDAAGYAATREPVCRTQKSTSLGFFKQFSGEVDNHMASGLASEHQVVREMLLEVSPAVGELSDSCLLPHAYATAQSTSRLAQINASRWEVALRDPEIRARVNAQLAAHGGGASVTTRVELFERSRQLYG